MRDITKRKRAESALHQCVMWEQLVSSVSSRFVNVYAGKLDQAINDTLAALTNIAKHSRA